MKYVGSNETDPLLLPVQMEEYPARSCADDVKMMRKSDEGHLGCDTSSMGANSFPPILPNSTVEFKLNSSLAVTANEYSIKVDKFNGELLDDHNPRDEPVLRFEELVEPYLEEIVYEFANEAENNHNSSQELPMDMEVAQMKEPYQIVQQTKTKSIELELEVPPTSPPSSLLDEGLGSSLGSSPGPQHAHSSPGPRLPSSSPSPLQPTPHTRPAPGLPVFRPNPALMSALLQLGVTDLAATKALYWTGNCSLQLAGNWIFERDEETLATPLEVEVGMLQAAMLEDEAEDSDEDLDEDDVPVFRISVVFNEATLRQCPEVPVCRAVTALLTEVRMTDQRGKELDMWEMVSQEVDVLLALHARHMEDLILAAASLGLVTWQDGDHRLLAVWAGEEDMEKLLGRLPKLD